MASVALESGERGGFGKWSLLNEDEGKDGEEEEVDWELDGGGWHCLKKLARILVEEVGSGRHCLELGGGRLGTRRRR